MPKRRTEDLKEYGRRGGKKGGKACLDTMTAKQRSERARKAGIASAKNLTAEERSERARHAALSRGKKGI